MLSIATVAAYSFATRDIWGLQFLLNIAILLILATLKDVMWYLIVGLIWISLIIQHLLKSYIVIWLTVTK